MYCTKCGKQVNVGTNFCTFCGNVLTNPQYTQNATVNKKPLIKRIWAVLLVVFWIIVVAGMVINALGYSTFQEFFAAVKNDVNSSVINIVKDSGLENYPDVTLEDLFNSYFDNITWKLDQIDGEKYVSVFGDSGACNFAIQYQVDNDGSVEFYALEIDGVPQSSIVYEALIFDILMELK